jgi:hypothetical protein
MLQVADWPQRVAIGGCEHILAALDVVLVDHGVRFAASPSGSLPANPKQENTMVHNAMRQEQEPALEPVDPQIDPCPRLARRPCSPRVRRSNCPARYPTTSSGTSSGSVRNTRDD